MMSKQDLGGYDFVVCLRPEVLNSQFLRLYKRQLTHLKIDVTQGTSALKAQLAAPTVVLRATDRVYLQFHLASGSLTVAGKPTPISKWIVAVRTDLLTAEVPPKDVLDNALVPSEVKAEVGKLDSKKYLVQRLYLGLKDASLPDGIVKEHSSLPDLPPAESSALLALIKVFLAQALVAENPYHLGYIPILQPGVPAAAGPADLLAPTAARLSVSRTLFNYAHLNYMVMTGHRKIPQGANAGVIDWQKGDTLRISHRRFAEPFLLDQIRQALDIKQPFYRPSLGEDWQAHAQSQEQRQYDLPPKLKDKFSGKFKTNQQCFVVAYPEGVVEIRGAMTRTVDYRFEIESQAPLEGSLGATTSWQVKLEFKATAGQLAISHHASAPVRTYHKDTATWLELAESSGSQGTKFAAVKVREHLDIDVGKSLEMLARQFTLRRFLLPLADDLNFRDPGFSSADLIWLRLNVTVNVPPGAAGADGGELTEGMP
jgi:hypothetical protein